MTSGSGLAQHDFRGRRARTLVALVAAGTDAILLGPGADLRYLTGFEHTHAAERLLAMVLRRDGSATWIVPSMNVAQVSPHLGGDEIHVWSDAQTYLPGLRSAVEGLNALAFDDELRSAFLLDLLAEAPSVSVRRSGPIMRTLRMRKDAAELAWLRSAAATVDGAIPRAIRLCGDSRAELDVEADLRNLLRERAPDQSVAFSIVASGPNAALPHHETGSRRMQTGDVVILDYGTRAEGYYSDITVTCSIGEPSDPEVRRVYRTVWEAQQAALQAIRPGVPCSEIDAAARAVIERAGYGERFLHRTGHGLGLQVHEPPNLVAGYDTVLEPGMTFSVEPGIYLEGRFGVRLEVIACVGADGVELINDPSSPELPIC